MATETTGFIKPTVATVNSGDVSNIENLEQGSAGNATITNVATITLTYGNIASLLPPNAIITRVDIKYTGTPSGINAFSQLSCHMRLENPSFGFPVEFLVVPTNDFFPADNGSSFTIDTSDTSISDADILNKIYVSEEAAVSNFNSSIDTIDVIVPGIKTGDTDIKLEFFHQSFTNFGPFVANMEFLGDSEVPGIQITYDILPLSVKIQSNAKVKLEPTIDFTFGTSLGGPTNFTNVGDVGDGVTYDTPEVSNLLFADSYSSNGTFGLSGTNMPRGVKFINFFNSDPIPSDAEIVGVEIVALNDPDGDGEAFIGSAGNNFGSFDMECYLYNGVTYSDKLTWDNTNTYEGITFFNTLGGSSNRARFSGVNRRYKNDTTGRDSLFGGVEDLSGLTWDVNNQDNFGFSLIWFNPIGSATAVVQRGFQMFVLYKQPSLTGNKVLIK